jgi:hypothetical protein
VSDFLVTIASYWFLSDATLAKNALEAAGIESVLDDQNMATIYANAVSGVKLRVRNTDALRAGQVLESECQSLEEIGEADEEPDDGICPACGSAEAVHNSRPLVFAALAVLILGIGVAVNRSDAAFLGVLAAGLLLLMTDRNRCAECGETWN